MLKQQGGIWRAKPWIDDGGRIVMRPYTVTLSFQAGASAVI